MKLRTVKLLPILMIGIIATAKGQGAFQDLDFEEANPGTGTSAALFPGWQMYIGTTPTTFVYYDDFGLSTPSISLWDDKTGFQPIQGNYTAELASASIGDPGSFLSDSVSLTQTGAVPS
ncbi:MAG TPA: hypothetical protein VGO67_06415 [Verrucomicrobiae bacterium]